MKGGGGEGDSCREHTRRGEERLLDRYTGCAVLTGIPGVHRRTTAGAACSAGLSSSGFDLHPSGMHGDHESTVARGATLGFGLPGNDLCACTVLYCICGDANGDLHGDCGGAGELAPGLTVLTSRRTLGALGLPASLHALDALTSTSRLRQGISTLTCSAGMATTELRIARPSIGLASTAHA